MSTFCMNPGVLAGIVVGTAAGTAILIILGVYVFVRVKGRKAKKAASVEASYKAPRLNHNGAHINPRFSIEDEEEVHFKQTVLKEPMGHRNRLNGSTKEVSDKSTLTNGDLRRPADEIPSATASYQPVKNESYHVGLQASQSIDMKAPDDRSLTLLLRSERLRSSEIQLRRTTDGIIVHALKKLHSDGTLRSESLEQGDRILSLKVDFTNISAENASAILGHAGSSTLILEIDKGPLESKSVPTNQPNDEATQPKWISFNDVSAMQKTTRRSSNGSSTDGSEHQSTKGGVYKSLDNIPGKDGEPMEYNPFMDEFFTKKSKEAPTEVHEVDKATNLMTVTAEINSPENKVHEHPDRPATDLGEMSGTGDHYQPSVVPSVIHTVTPDHPNFNATTAETASPKPTDPYAGLSHEDRMQLIRLSYEETDLSQSTPNLSIAQTTGKPLEPPKEEHGPQEASIQSAIAHELAEGTNSKIPQAMSPKKERKTSILKDLDQLEAIKSSEVAQLEQEKPKVRFGEDITIPDITPKVQKVSIGGKVPEPKAPQTRPAVSKPIAQGPKKAMAPSVPKAQDVKSPPIAVKSTTSGSLVKSQDPKAAVRSQDPKHQPKPASPRLNEPKPPPPRSFDHKLPTPRIAASPKPGAPRTAQAASQDAKVPPRLSPSKTAQKPATTTTIKTAPAPAPAQAPNPPKEPELPSPIRGGPGVRKNSLTNTSSASSSVVTSTTADDSDRVSSPEVFGLNRSLEDEMEKEQFEKLMYFQQQLEKQHEELSRLGVNVPSLEGKETTTAKKPKMINGKLVIPK